MTYSEAVHILLDCLRYSNQAESNRFAGDGARRELWFWNMDSIADSHEAPDMTDFGWQDTNNQHFYGEKSRNHFPCPAAGPVGPTIAEHHFNMWYEIVADICSSSVHTTSPVGFGKKKYKSKTMLGVAAVTG